MTGRFDNLLFICFLATVTVLMLTGCDSAELDRIQRAEEYKTRFFNSCLPRKGDIVTATWVKGELLCRRITTSPRYGKTFPHAEVRVATIEDNQ